MARFEAYRMRDSTDIVLDCQADLLTMLPTRFVVPLVPAVRFRALYPRLNPIFRIADAEYVLATQMAGTVPCNRMGNRVAGFGDEQTAIMNALDMLLTGY